MNLDQKSDGIGCWPGYSKARNGKSAIQSTNTLQAKKAVRLIEEALAKRKKNSAYQNESVCASRERGRMNYSNSVKARMLADRLFGKKEGVR